MMRGMTIHTLGELRASGYASAEVQDRIDGEAAVLILRDYLRRDQHT